MRSQLQCRLATALLLLALSVPWLAHATTQHKLEVFIAADDEWSLSVNGGERTLKTGTPALNPSVQSYTVDSGDLLLAFTARDVGGPGSVGGFIASVFVDGEYVAATGASNSPPWKVNYAFNDSLPSAAGWNTSVSYNDTVWPRFNISCSSSPLWTAKSSIAVNSAPAQWLWAPQCNVNGNSLVIRLVLNIPDVDPPPPPTGQHQLEILLAAQDMWTATVNGIFHYDYSTATTGNTKITQNIDEGKLVIGFSARNFGTVGGFIANIRIDGRSVAVTGDRNPWTAIYNFDPTLPTSAGWDSDVNFDDSKWVDKPSGCANFPEAWVQPSQIVSVGNAYPQWMWGSSCSVLNSAVYYRLVLDVDSALLNPTPTPKGSRKLTVALAADRVWTTVLAGEIFTGYNRSTLEPVTLTTYVNPGTAVLAFYASSTRSGMFAASIWIDDVPVAASGDSSQWMGTAALNPAAAANSDWMYSVTPSSNVWKPVSFCTSTSIHRDALNALSINGATPHRLWGPACSGSQVYYHLVITVPTVFQAPFVGTRQLSVRLAANSFWWANLNGSYYVAYNVDEQVATEITQTINNGTILLAFAARAFSGLGAFSASVTIDGKTVAVTGDNSNWKVLYGSEAPYGWYTQYNFDDSLWSNWTGTCPSITTIWPTALQFIGGSPQWPSQTLWGPDCSTKGASAYYRLKLNVTQALLYPTLSPPSPSAFNHTVTLTMMGEDFWLAKIDGNAFTDTDVLPQTQKIMTVQVYREVFLLAISVRAISAGSGFAALLSIDGVPVAVSGDNSGWKVSYTFSPTRPTSRGWDTNVAFDDSAWLSYVGQCLPSSKAVGLTLNSMSNGTVPRWLWGPQCTVDADDAYYRLAVNVTRALANPVPLTPAAGLRRIDVRVVSKTMWVAKVAGRDFARYNLDSPYYQTITTNTSNDVVLFSFAAKDVLNSAGGFAATIYVDGTAVAVTGDSSDWKVSYTVNTADPLDAGWDSSLNYTDSAWSSWLTSCPVPQGELTTSMILASADLSPSFVWGPLCSSPSSTVLLRLKLNITDALLKTAALSYSGSHQMDINLVADETWIANLGGKKINGYGSGFFQPTTISRNISDGMMLLAFSVYSGGGGGGFAATIFIDGKPVVVTGDSTDWLVSYNINLADPASSGWDTNLTYPDSTWSSWTGACPPYSIWAPTLNSISNFSSPQMVWGPTCGTQSGTMYLRLKLNVTDALLRPTPVDALGSHKLDISIAADDVWTTYVGGKVYAGNSVPSRNVTTVTRYVGDGIVLLAFMARDYSAGGGFLASVSIDGIPVAATGDKSKWKAHYSLNVQSSSATGWNSDLNFNDSSWSDSIGLCPPGQEWGTVIQSMASNVTFPRMIWGPTCTSTGNAVYYRLTVNVTDLLNRPSVLQTGSRKLAVRIAASGSWTATANSQVFYGYGLVGQEIRSMSTQVDDAFLLTFQVRDYGVGGSFLASVYLDDQLVATTGDASNWKVHYTFDPVASASAGWDSSYDFADSAWSNWIGSCPDTDWDSTAVSLSSSNAYTQRLWGPTCWSKSNTVYYRLKVNATATTAPVVSTGSNRIDVAIACKDEWLAYINGTSFMTTVPSFVPKVITKYVNDGDALLSFRVRDIGAGGAFIASVFINGLPVAVSGDISGQWKIAYHSATQFDPAKLSSAGWNSNLNFNDVLWSSWMPACLKPTGAEQAIANVAVNGTAPGFVWGPSCNATKSISYLRLKVTATANGGVIVPPSGARELKIVLLSVGDWNVRIGGYLVPGYSVSSNSAVQTIIRMVDDGPLLIAFSTRSTSSAGGIVASIFVDNVPIAATGDDSDWSANYTVSPAPNWDTSLSFAADNWLPVVSSCTPDSTWTSEMQQLSINGAKPSLVWGPACNSAAFGYANYRLRLNVGGTTVPALIPISDSPTAARQLKILVAGDSDWKLYFKGTQYGGSKSSGVSTINRKIDNEVILLSFSAKSSSSTPGLAVTVLVDNTLVAYSGDLSTWKAAYSFNPNLDVSAGWNSDLNFNDILWTAGQITCPTGSLAPTLPLMTTRGVTPNVIWGPSCSTTNNYVYFRLKISVTSAILKDGQQASSAAVTTSRVTRPVSSSTADTAALAATESSSQLNSSISAPAISTMVITFLIIGGIIVAAGIGAGVYITFFRAKKKPQQRLIPKPGKKKVADDAASSAASSYSLDYSQMAFSPEHQKAGAAASGINDSASVMTQSQYSVGSHEGANLVPTDVYPDGGHPNMYGSDAKKGYSNSNTATVLDVSGQKSAPVNLYSPQMTEVQDRSSAKNTLHMNNTATLELYPGKNGQFRGDIRSGASTEPTSQYATILDEAGTKAGGTNGMSEYSTVLDEAQTRGGVSQTIPLSQYSTVLDEAQSRGKKGAVDGSTLIDEAGTRGQGLSQFSTVIDSAQARGYAEYGDGSTILEEAGIRGHPSTAGRASDPLASSEAPTVLDDAQARGYNNFAESSTILEEADARGYPKGKALEQVASSEVPTVLDDAQARGYNNFAESSTNLEEADARGYPSSSAQNRNARSSQHPFSASSTVIDDARTRGTPNVFADGSTILEEAGTRGISHDMQSQGVTMLDVATPRGVPSNVPGHDFADGSTILEEAGTRGHTNDMQSQGATMVDVASPRGVPQKARGHDFADGSTILEEAGTRDNFPGAATATVLDDAAARNPQSRQAATNNSSQQERAQSYTDTVVDNAASKGVGTAAAANPSPYYNPAAFDYGADNPYENPPEFQTIVDTADPRNSSAVATQIIMPGGQQQSDTIVDDATSRDANVKKSGKK